MAGRQLVTGDSAGAPSSQQRRQRSRSNSKRMGSSSGGPALTDGGQQPRGKLQPRLLRVWTTAATPPPKLPARVRLGSRPLSSRDGRLTSKGMSTLHPLRPLSSPACFPGRLPTDTKREGAPERHGSRTLTAPPRLNFPARDVAKRAPR